MRVGIGIGGGRDGWEGAAAFLQEAERLGVDSAWTSEAWGFDAFTPLAYMAGKTEHIKLGTSIAQAGTRTPAAIAMTALTLASLSEDRFILGLGTVVQVIELRRPARAVRETVGSCAWPRAASASPTGRDRNLPGRTVRAGAQVARPKYKSTGHARSKSPNDRRAGGRGSPSYAGAPGLLRADHRGRSAWAVLRRPGSARRRRNGILG
jgi:hypothetical protein